MFAQLGRYLNQQINDILDWDVDLIFQMHDQIAPILDAERPPKD